MTLGIIVARSGSKGLKNKNSRDLGGKPLVQWVMETAKKSKKIDTLIMSTDCSISISIAIKNEIEVPFIRPKEFASDTSLIVDTLLHSLNFYEDQGIFFDHVVLLQPTSPFTSVEDIDRAIVKAREKNADTIISGYNSGQTNPSIMYSTDEDGIVSWNTGGEKMGNRQDLNTVFQRSGNIYVIKSDLIKSRKIYGDSI
jgi:CMP-N,N'-diacetyllegionaminic acid synthase